MTALADLSLREVAAAIAAGERTSLEVVDACLDRARAVASLGAYAALDADGARRAAREWAGREGGSLLGGVPVSVKDVFDVAGLPTRAGSEATDAAPAAADAAAVALLRRAGAVIVGKTSTHEFACGVTARAARNPWDTARLAGGSSGGAAVAVATGTCFAALGTDTAGSCRIPAAFCGVTGLSPRHGTLPVAGVVPLAPSFDRGGLLARTAEDLALAWSALTGEEVAEATAPVAVGVVAEAALGPVDADALAAAEHVAATLVSAGAARREADVPTLDAFSRPRGVVVAAEALGVHRGRGWWPGRAERYGEDVAAELRRAERAEDGAVADARAELRALGARLERAVPEAGVLVLPTTPRAAPARAMTDVLRREERRHAGELTRLCGPVNAAPLAAISVFGGLDASGMPLGVQIVGRDEASVLRAALAYEARGGKPPRPPALAGG